MCAERINSLKKLARDTLGISAYHYGRNKAELTDEVYDQANLIGLGFGILEFAAPSISRLDRTIKGFQSIKHASSSFIRDFTSLAAPVLILGITSLSTSSSELGLSAGIFSKLATNALIHREINGLINRMTKNNNLVKID